MKCKSYIIFLLWFFNLLPSPLLQAKTADYVIVGVGTAGAVLAKIFTEKFSKAIIERQQGLKGP